MKLPAYDDANRPSCGPDSAFYGSGVEVAWNDADGRPSSGAGSGQYLAGSPLTFVFDHHGVPSCGPGSKLYGSEPATPTATLIISNTTSVNTNFAAQAVTATSVHRGHAGLGQIPVTFGILGTASVRSVTGQWTIRDPFGSPSSTVNPAFDVLAGTITVTTGFTVPLPVMPVGTTAELVLRWEQLIPVTADGVIVTVIVTAVPSFIGPNGGEYPVYDSLGRPSVGPGSAHYLDRVLVLDDEDRPSCGTGSDTYLDGADAVNDDQGRPSCGAGSGSYKAHPAVTAPVGNRLPGIGNTTVGSDAAQTFDVTLNACQLATGRVHGVAGTPDASIHSVTVSYTYTKQDGTPATTSPVACAVAVTGDPTLFCNYLFSWASTNDGTWYSPFPSIPADIDPYSSVVAHIAAVVTAVSIPSSWVLDAVVYDCPSYPGPNGGTDRDCAQGPNHGVEVACAGPNAGVDAPLTGSEPSCDQCTPGPNEGVDRTAETGCVSLLSLCPVTFQGGWPGPWATGDFPHPGDSACIIPALCIAGQDRLEGRQSPTGRVPWQVRFYNGGLPPCAGSRILAVRLRVTMQSPTGTGALWTLQAVDPRTDTVYGGVAETTRTVAGVEVTYALNVTTTDELVNLAVLGDLAAPANGTEGWVDSIRLEVQYVGGPLCRDCGPNLGVPVACDSDDAIDDEIPYPSTNCVAYTPVDGTETVPVITINAGTVDVDGILLTFTPNPDGLPCDGGNDRWQAVTPCAQWWIPTLPAGARIRIDGRLNRVIIEAGPTNGRLLVFGDRWRRPATWPTFTSPVCVCASVGDHDDARFSLDVALVQRTLNGGM